MLYTYLLSVKVKDNLKILNGQVLLVKMMAPNIDDK